jgi:nitrous oxidase accessory protein NosD
MKTTTILTAILLTANLCRANELQQQYEQAYYLETAKGQTEQAVVIYEAVAAAKPTEENKTAIKQSLLRLLHFATVDQSESATKDCHEKLLQGTDTTVQELLDATEPGGTIYIPAGLYTAPFTINKEISLKGTDRDECIFEIKAERPLIRVNQRNKVTIESLTLKNQLETSRRKSISGFTIVAHDATVSVRNCRFVALGKNKQSPGAVYAKGFSNIRLEDCHFEGFENTIQYGEGSKGEVTNCVIQNPEQSGIIVAQNSMVTIEGSLITGSLNHGVRNMGGILVLRNNLIIKNMGRSIYFGKKVAQGEIANNAIIGNDIGLLVLSPTTMEITNNLFLDNLSAGIATRGHSRISVKANIFAGNDVGISLPTEEEYQFKVGDNTFWKNNATSTNVKLPASIIQEDPTFTNPDIGNFSTGNQNIKSAGHGLSNPEAISLLWKKYAEITQ